MQDNRKDEVLTAEEAAEYLKMALSTLYRYMRKGQVPCFKVGNQWRFKRSVLDKWIEQKISFDTSSQNTGKEKTMREKNQRKKDVGFDLGLGGIFKGIGSLLEAASELSEKASEIKREGEIGSDEDGFKAVYGFSVKLGGKGSPTVEHFGNVRDKGPEGPVVDDVREPMTDIFDEDEFLRIIAEMPGVNEADIKYEVKGNDILTISGETGDRKYYKELLLPDSVDKEKISHSCNNGIFEIKLWKAGS